MDLQDEKLQEQLKLIPKICKYFDGWSCEAYQGKEIECPEICPNFIDMTW